MKPVSVRLALIMLLAASVVGVTAVSCGGGSTKNETPTSAAPARTNTPMAMATNTAAAPKATQPPATAQATQPPATAQAASVQIKDFEFTPNTLTIKVGSTVTWTNGGSTHTVTADDGSFDSGQLQNGKSYSRTFDSAGTFTYHCSIHPFMKAQVTVE